MFDLTNRAAVVTGAARGIGYAIGRRFLEAGATVTFADIDPKGLEAARAQLAKDVPGADKRAAFASADISKAEDAAALIAGAYARAGRLDILVNNAGLADVSDFVDLDVAKMRRVFDVNVFGTFMLAQAAAKLMQKAGYGRVINIASISGVRAGWARTAYGTSKAAVIHLTRQMAMELGKSGITVNAILPGPVDTELARAVHTAETRQAYLRGIPAERYGTVDEIAYAAVFLASEEAAYVNGVPLPVDGGFVAAGIKFDDLKSDARGSK